MYFIGLNLLNILLSLVLFIILLFLYLKIVRNNDKFFNIGITFLFISGIICIITLLGPRGNIEGNNVIGTNIEFILDVSTSMDAGISKTNNNTKLELSKELIKNYIINNTNNKYALTIFSGNALNVIPFVSDTDIYNMFLYGVNKNNLNKNGTNIIESLDTGILNFRNIENGGLIILITDGGEDNNNFKEISKKLKANNIDLLIIGIGDIKGNYIPIGFDNSGKILYKYYKGEKVITHLNEDLLKDIVSSLGGNYIRFEKEEDINIISEKINNYTNGKILKETYKYRKDISRYFIFIAFISFLIFFIILFLSKTKSTIGKRN